MQSLNIASNLYAVIIKIVNKCRFFLKKLCHVSIYCVYIIVYSFTDGLIWWLMWNNLPAMQGIGLGNGNQIPELGGVPWRR